MRKHRNRTLLELGVMAEQVLQAVLARVGTGASPATGPATLTQFEQTDGVWTPRSTQVEVLDRPPMLEFGQDLPEIE